MRYLFREFESPNVHMKRVNVFILKKKQKKKGNNFEFVGLVDGYACICRSVRN